MHRRRQIYRADRGVWPIGDTQHAMRHEAYRYVGPRCVVMKRYGNSWVRLAPEMLSLRLTEYVVYDAVDYDAEIQEIAAVSPEIDRWLTIWACNWEQAFHVRAGGPEPKRA